MQVQVLLSAPKQTKTNRNYSVRFFISWFATGLVTMQCIVCTLRVPLRAVQLAQRFASKLARLCYYARFAHYKSCCPHQKRQSERVVFFHATADLKQNCVLSANGTAFVCLCTQLTRRSAIILPCLRYYARSALYKSCCPHQNKQKRTEIIRFVFSYLGLQQDL